MGVYRYIANEPAIGSTSRGELTADSAYQVRLALRRMGLVPARIDEMRDRGRLRLSGRAPALNHVVQNALRNRRRAGLVELYESLAVMLATGTPIAQALDLAARTGQSKTRSSTLCRTLADSIRKGTDLGTAMGQWPDWFGPIDVALVRSAEAHGETDRALSELADLHGRSEELRGRLAMVLAYPTLLLVFGIGVVIFLTTQTLPQLAGVLQDADVALPAATRLLLALGAIVTSWWPVAVLLAIVVIATAVWASRSVKLARIRLRVPLLGVTLMRSQIGSVSTLLSRLLRAGLPLTDSIALVTPTVPNAALRSGLDGLRRALEEGKSASQHLEETGLFEPVFCQVVGIGEESGELEQTLETIGERYRASAARLIDRLAGALEPAAILTLAAMVGFVVYAALAPMLRLSQTL